MGMGWASPLSLDEIPLDAGSTSTLAVVSGLLVVASLASLLVVRKRRFSAVDANGCDVGREVAKQIPVERKIRVFFGTQTGTAEQFASEMVQKLEAHFDGVTVDCMDLEVLGEDLDTAASKFNEAVLSLVLCSTYGDGEPPDTAAPFFEWLKTRAEEADGMNEAMRPLAGTHFAVFGLGNTSYELYNKSSKVLDTQLEQCGGIRVMKLALGNDDEDIEDDYQKWVEQITTVIADKGYASEGGDRTSIGGDGNGNLALAPPPAAYTVEVQNGNVKPYPQVNVQKAYDSNAPFNATIHARRELQAPRSGRSTLHVEVDIAGSNLTYQTGDHLGVYPTNDPALVQQMAARLNVNETDVILVSEGSSAKPRSMDGGGRNGVNPLGHKGPLTVHTALARYCDLLTPPKKSALLALATCTASETEATQLRHLASKEGKEEYASWVLQPYRSLLEVLEEFPSVQPSLGLFLCSVAPRLQPRYYSISASPLVAPTTPSLTVAVVGGTTGTGRLHAGVASSWLGALKLNHKLAAPVFVRTSNFRMPKDPATPIVMVGPGTGLAPFRGFLQERAVLKERGDLLGPALLFFGCRNSAEDYIYADELEEFRASGALTQLRVAFSREGPQKVYVQHLLEESGAEVWKMMTAKGSRGHIYVCGDAKQMARDVNKALLDIIQKHGKLSEVVAENMIKSWSENGRYSRDVW